MKKSTKLLSVLLAVLMIFSTMSVMASAYQKEYKTSEAITALKGYNDIDTVTRLPVDVRADMILDWLDETLAGMNIYMNLSVLGTLDAHSVDSTLDSIVQIADGGIFNLASGLGWLGDVGQLNVDALKTYRRSSANTGSEYVLYSVFEWLGNSNNVGLIQKVANGSIKFGNIIGQLVGPYEKYIRDIPGLLAGMIASLTARADDTAAEIAEMAAPTDFGNFVKNFVIKLFTKPQSWTTYKEDAAGNCVSGHTLPTAAGKRNYYEKNGNSFTVYVYDTSTEAYKAEDGTYDRVAELDGDDKPTGYYVYEKKVGDNTEALKYYKDGSYWLTSLAQSGKASTIMDITARTPVQMLYDMIPYVFEAMAPTVLNGSVKKLLGEWFGAEYNYVGKVGSAEVAALPDASDVFFTQEQGDYLWEWSDYKVISGNHYYRFEDDIYAADLSNTNEFFTLVKFDYKITGDYLNEFIPTTTTDNTKTLLSQANNLIAKAFGDIINTDVLGYTWPTGGNETIIDNVRDAFTAILNMDEHSGERIFRDLYDADLVSMVKSGSGVSNQKVATVLIAFLAKSLMPQLVLPAYADINSMLEVGAVVVRELATQLIPGNDFDELIYANYTTTTLASHTDAEWLDIILTMGSQIGVFYLNNIADLALTDPALGGFVEKKTWHTADATISGIPAWKATVDFIIDWALEDDNGATGAWKFGNLVNTAGLTIDRNSVQDPWTKLNQILTSLLPVGEVLNVSATEYPTLLEQILRGNIVEAVLSLDVNKLVGMFAIPNDSFLRTMKLEPAVAYMLRKLINDIGRFGDTSKPDVIASSFTSINSVLSKDGLATLVGALLPRLSECRVALINTVLPFLNWLIGWSSNDQTFRAATVSAPRYSYNGSAVGTLEGSITVKNNANGMERQYASGDGYAYDSNYEIQITGATASVDGITVSFPTERIAAGNSASLTLSGSFSTAQPVIYRVYYKIYSATGAELANGKTFVTNAYSYLALTDSDENVTKAEHDPGRVGAKRMSHSQYIFTQDVVSSVNSFATEFQNFDTNLGDLGKITITGMNSDTAPVGEAANYFRHATADEIKAEMPSIDRCNTILSIAKMGQVGTAHLYKVKDGVKASDIPYGYYDMGQIAVKMKRSTASRSCTDGVVFVYYTDYDLPELVETVEKAGITSDRIDLTKAGAQAAWDEFEAAMKEASGLINMPYVAATMVSEWMPKAEASKARLDAAYANIQTYFSGADISSLTAVYAATEGVNYQNVKFYRYTKYEAAQRAADSIIAGQTAPKAPEKYIKNAGLSAEEIDKMIAAEGDTFIQGLLTNTVKQPEDKDVKAYDKTMKTWKAAALMDYDVAIAAENLQLMYDRVITKATDKTFLNREIQTAEARAFDANLYAAESYKAYTDALAEAKVVSAKADATQKEAFDAKYALLVAENNLLLKTESCVEQGNYNALNALVATAQSMLANPGDYTLANGSTDEKEVKDAWTKLLQALGYVYTNEKNETTYLYSGSALSYTTHDRVNNFANLERLTASEGALTAAIAQFKSNAADPVLVPEDGTGNATTGVVAIEEGYIYGLSIGGNIEDYFQVKDGTMVVELGTATATNGTGAKVLVKNNSGDTVAVYTLIVYGDVDGNAKVNLTDYGQVLQVATGTTSAVDLPERLEAADADHNAKVNLTDYGQVLQAATGTTDAIDQVK